jgi:hypothetical protein
MRSLFIMNVFPDSKYSPLHPTEGDFYCNILQYRPLRGVEGAVFQENRKRDQHLWNSIPFYAVLLLRRLNNVICEYGYLI